MGRFSRLRHRTTKAPHSQIWSSWATLQSKGSVGRPIGFGIGSRVNGPKPVDDAAWGRGNERESYRWSVDTSLTSWLTCVIKPRAQQHLPARQPLAQKHANHVVPRAHPEDSADAVLGLEAHGLSKRAPHGGLGLVGEAGAGREGAPFKASSVHAPLVHPSVLPCMQEMQAGDMHALGPGQRRI